MTLQGCLQLKCVLLCFALTTSLSRLPKKKREKIEVEMLDLCWSQSCSVQATSGSGGNLCRRETAS